MAMNAPDQDSLGFIRVSPRSFLGLFNTSTIDHEEEFVDYRSQYTNSAKQNVICFMSKAKAGIPRAIVSIVAHRYHQL